LQGFDVHAVTDVTGFGLAGHAFEMARASHRMLTLRMDRLPVMREALEMYRRGVNTGVNPHNRRMVQNYLQMDGDWPPWQQEIIFDPQTSGGLLAAVAGETADALVEALRASGVPDACKVGAVLSPQDDDICLRIV
jgi:selenide,water dikinase